MTSSLYSDFLRLYFFKKKIYFLTNDKSSPSLDTVYYRWFKVHHNCSGYEFLNNNSWKSSWSQEISDVGSIYLIFGLRKESQIWIVYIVWWASVVVGRHQSVRLNSMFYKCIRLSSKQNLCSINYAKLCQVMKKPNLSKIIPNTSYQFEHQLDRYELKLFLASHPSAHSRAYISLGPL